MTAAQQSRSVYSTGVISLLEPAQPWRGEAARLLESCRMPNGSPNDTNNSPWWIGREDGTESFKGCQGVPLLRCAIVAQAGYVRNASNARAMQLAREDPG